MSWRIILHDFTDAAIVDTFLSSNCSAMDYEWGCSILDSFSNMLCSTLLSGNEVKTLKNKVFNIAADLAVHRELTKTETWLSGRIEEDSKTHVEKVRVYKNRLGTMLKEVYKDRVEPMAKDEISVPRMKSLRGLDTLTLIFVGMTYQPLFVSKMSQIDFTRLLVLAPIYVQKHIPLSWMFRSEVQEIVVHAISEVGQPSQALSLHKGTCSYYFNANLTHS
jgi:hypothetical protein